MDLALDKVLEELIDGKLTTCPSLERIFVRLSRSDMSKVFMHE